MAGYIPECGDVVWTNFSPQTGHEQAGRRPALVLSPRAYNRAAGLALLCPITSRIKGYPFEVPLPDKFPVSGVVLVDQVRSLDWRARGLELVAKIDSETLGEAFARLRPLVAPDTA